MKHAALITLAVLAIACATPQLFPPPTSGTSGTAKGGDADTDMPNIDVVTAFAQPGSTSVAAPVTNSDRVQNTQAGDSPQLVFGGGGKAAFDYLSSSDPVQDLILEQIEWSSDDRSKEGADFIAIDARIDILKAELGEHMKMKLENARAMTENFAKLTTVVFSVLNIKLNGVPPDKLSADALKAAAEHMKAAMKPATNATD